jgi:hypothetical protein
MSNGRFERRCAGGQREKSAAGGRGPKPRRGKGGKKTEGEDKAKNEGQSPDQPGKASVPVDPEDYKGARKKLRHAVKAEVKANSEKIAEKLVGKVKEGDLRGTEMVLTLMEKKKAGKDAKKKKHGGLNWADLMPSEPEWDASKEEFKDQGSGSKGRKASQSAAADRLAS